MNCPFVRIRDFSIQNLSKRVSDDSDDDTFIACAIINGSEFIMNCTLYLYRGFGSNHAHQGSRAADIQDDPGDDILFF